MKITDKVSDQRLRERFGKHIEECSKAELRKREADSKKRDPEGSIDDYITMLTEQASIESELLSARTALGADPSHRIAAALERIADRLDSWDCEQNEKTKGHGLYTDGEISASVSGEVSTS